MAIDANLSATKALPAANATAILGPIDMQVDAPALQDQWRLGRLRVTVPACPNNVNASLNITLTLQDYIGTDNANAANTSPIIQGVIPGVVSTGSPATTIDFPLPPGLRGPVQLLVAVPTGAGDNTGVTATAEWLNE